MNPSVRKHLRDLFVELMSHTSVYLGVGNIEAKKLKSIIGIIQSRLEGLLKRKRSQMNSSKI